jgi:hypothetical protein
MKKLRFILCSFLAMIALACSKPSGTTEEKDLYQNVPSSNIPAQLVQGLWFSGTLSAISYYDRNGYELGRDYEAGREYQFYHQNGKGRIRFWQYLGTRTSSSCVTEIYTRKEGSVVFEGDKFTFYPVAGSFKTIKKGCTTNSVTERKAERDDLKPTVFLWELKEVNGETYLYTYLEDDVDHEDPVFVYQYGQ